MSMFNLFRKSEIEQKDIDFYNDQEAALPVNYAQSVMELQMQLEFIDTYNIEVVQQLNELYRMGIQYYINFDPKKANHFKSKLTTLLTHPNTLDLIQKKPESAKIAHLNVGGYNRSLKQELGKFNSQSQIVVRSIMEGSEKKIEKHHKLIDQNLNTQEKRLQGRLEERSRSRSTKRLT